MNFKTTRLLSTLLLISVFAVGASVNAQSQPDKSADLSPVKTNALALLSELEKPSVCPPDDTLCLAEILQSKLQSAIAGLKSIVRVDEQREGIIADLQTRIDIRGGIIDDLKKVDANSQVIDQRGQEISAVWREQHNENKQVIADLKHDLDSCRSNQKWIAGLSMLGGGYIGYKLRGAGAIQNPFQFNSGSNITSAQKDFLNFSFSQTKTEEAMRRAIKNVNQ